MKTFTVDPLIGVGPVSLGASRETVIAELGAPEESFFKAPTSLHPTDAWFSNGFQVFYQGVEPTVAFIELSTGCNFHVVLFGVSVFTTEVPMVISEIMSRAELDKTDPELGYSYTFPSLELSFWRPSDNDKEEPYFSTVGIGVSGYFSA